VSVLATRREISLQKGEKGVEFPLQKNGALWGRGLGTRAGLESGAAGGEVEVECSFNPGTGVRILVVLNFQEERGRGGCEVKEGKRQ